MVSARFLLFSALAACAASSLAQGVPVPGTRSYLGLSPARAPTEGCALTALVCDRERPANIYAGTMIGKYWGAEVGYMDSGRLWRSGVESRAQGLNFSVVGRARVMPSVGVFGRVGTTYGRPDTGVMGNSAEQGFGLSFGGGVSYDITPRLSATFEWDRYDLRFAGGRDPVYSTNLGLRLRY